MAQMPLHMWPRHKLTALRLALISSLAWQAVWALPIELNPSVLVLGRFDYVPYQTAPPFTSRCTDMVDRALERAGGTSLVWVPTIYWLSSKEDKSDVTGYCYMDGFDGKTSCKPVTQALIDEFREWLKLCVAEGSNRGINEIAVVPHLDEASRLSAAWRNAILFAPRTKYAGFTYEEALLNPIADAVGAVAKPWSIIHFALQGEMSATVTNYPGQYLELIPRVRQRIISAAAAQGVTLPPEQVRIGLSWNFNKLVLAGLSPAGAPRVEKFSSVVVPSPSAPLKQRVKPAAAASPPAIPPVTSSGKSATSMHSTATSVTDAAAPQVTAQSASEGGRRRGLLQLLQFVDSVLRARVAITKRLEEPAEDGGATPGAEFLENLPSVSSTITAGSTISGGGSSNTVGLLDVPTLKQLLQSCNFQGISAYAGLNTVDFQLSEFQNSAFTFLQEFEASTSIDIEQIMKDYNQELHYSEFGVGGGLTMDGQSPARTAFQVARQPYFGVYPKYYNPALDPWHTAETHNFMVTFWRKACKWLAQGAGPTYRPTKVFMWTQGSYDVLAIYTESTSPAGSYFTQEVSTAVLQHNAAASAAIRAAQVGG